MCPIRRIALVVLLLAAAGLLMPCRATSQVILRKDQPDLKISPQERTEVIDGVLKKLNEAYVFRDKAREMEKAVRARQKEYDNITSARVLADRLTDHLQEVSHDKHLRVVYSHDPLPRPHKPSPDELLQRRLRDGWRPYLTRTQEGRQVLGHAACCVKC